MELIEGQDFFSHVRGRPERFVPAALQVVEALTALHQASIVHRDIKPSNVRVRSDGSVVVLDLGAARPLGQLAKPELDEVVGTPAYLAPELAFGASVDYSTDIYSLGVMLYEALTERLPFDERAADPILAKYETLQPLSVALAAPLAEAIMAAVSPHPEERPALEAIRASLSPSEAVRERAVGPSVAAFVGRGLERSRIDARFEELSIRRELAFVELRGPSGIGKSFLLEQTLGAWHATERAVVLRGRCLPHAVVPFPGLDGLVDDLAAWLSSHPPSSLPEAGTLASLLAVFPALGRAEVLVEAASGRVAAQPTERRSEAFLALSEVLMSVAQSRVLVLAIDDAQWVDADSGLFLEGFMRRAAGVASMLVLSVRTPDARRSQVLARLRAVAAATTGDLEPMQLGEMARADIVELIRGVAAQRLDVDQVHRLTQQANGSPWFAVQLARYTSQVGSSSVEGAADRLVAERLARLEIGARRLLVAACLAHEPLSVDVAGRVVGVSSPRAAARRLLGERYLVRDAPLTRGLRLVPYHDRIRETVVASLEPEEKQTLHRRLAAELARVEELTSVARVWHLKEGGLTRDAFAAALEATGVAAGQMAFDLAAQLLAVALENPPPEEPTWQLWRQYSDLLMLAGRLGDAAEASLRAATELCAVDARAPAVATLRNRAAEFFLRSGDMGRGQRLLETCLREARVPVPRRSLSLLASIAWQRALVRRADPLTREPSSVSSELQQRQIESCWTAMIGLVWSDVILGTHFQLRHSALSLRHGNVAELVRALAAEGCYLAVDVNASVERSKACIERARSLAARASDPRLTAFAEGCGSASAYMRGEFSSALLSAAEAERHVRRSRERGDWTFGDSHVMRMNTFASMGALDEMRQQSPLLLDYGEQTGDQRLISSARIRDLTPLAAGNPQELRRRVDVGLRPWRLAPRSMLHVWHAQALVRAALYEVRLSAAREHLATALKTAGDALLMRMRVVRFELLYLQGAVGLAQAITTSSRQQRRAALLQALEAAWSLSRHRSDWSAGLVKSLLAGVARHWSREARVEALLASADRSFEAGGLSLLRSVVQYQRGRAGGLPSWVGEPGRLCWAMLPLGSPPS